MFASPILEKGSRFPSPVLRVVYVLNSNTGKRFYRFPSPVLGKGYIGSPVQYWEKVIGAPVQYWEKVLGSANQYWDMFYRFPRPVQGKGSRFPSPVLRKLRF